MPWGLQGEPSLTPPTRAGWAKCVHGAGARARRHSSDVRELRGQSTSPSSSRRVSFGSYDNYIPVGDISKKSWNQQHFSQMFSKPNRPGKKWRSTPSELRENSPIGDVVKDDQKAAPMWMTRSLLKISEKPSAYLAARRKPPFFTGLQRRSESTDSSLGEKKLMYKEEKYQVEKTSKKKMAGLPKGSKTKLLDTADDNLSRESESESKGSGESKPKNGMNSHKDKEPDPETKDMDVNKKNKDKKKKSKESDVESNDSKNGKKKDKISRSKSRDLDKGSKKKSKDADFEFKDTVKKDTDVKKTSTDFNVEQKYEKEDKDSRRKSKVSGTESKDAKKKNKNSRKKSKDLNNKSQNLKMEDKKHKEGDMESQNSNDSKKKSKESDISKDLKKPQDGKITFRGLDIEATETESETSHGTLSLRSCFSQQMLPQLVKPGIRKAPLPEAQWIQKLI
ncbi:cylicin-2-like [Petaurus breviceps papuanus]|uniref:cylicin-2-like n=1 Tax=Petaurus breviceps papuanus TaxID=3040969 RepID=UPI0036DD2AD4